MCENLILNHLTVRNPWYSQNGDGVDVESCKNVIIKDCSFDVGDDAICMKSGKNEDGRRRGIPAENIIVEGCTVYHGHGGFVVGSEMSGGVKNIEVKNCLFIGTDVGLRFKSTRGRGGIVENIYIDNICMNAIPEDALLFDLFYGGKGAGEETAEEIAARMGAAVPQVDETTPQFRDINIENVICNGAKRAIYFNGLPEMPIQNVTLRNIKMSAENGATFNQTENITKENVVINGEEIL
jgi:polygalacturonase